MCHAGLINRAGIRTWYANRCKQLPTPTQAIAIHARASIICEAAALCWRVARSLPLFMDAFRSTESYWDRPPAAFRADSMLPVTWGRPQPLQGWF